MQSKTSCFNTVIRKNLLRFWPLWGINIFFCVIIPLAVTLSWDNFTSKTTAEILYNVCDDALPAYFLIYSCGVAMAVWSYLYNNKSIGLMHSLPITRNRLFAASFVSGMIMLLIPIAVGALLFALLCILKGAFVFLPFLISAVITVAEAFIFFAIATFVAHLTGHILALPVLYFVLNLLAVLLEYVIGTYLHVFTYGLTAGYGGYASFLSPVVQIYQGVDYVEGRLIGSSVGANGVTGVMYDSTFDKYNPEWQYITGWGTLAAYVIAGIGLTALALFLLYRKRKSETAGEVVSAKILRPVALACFTACAALTGGLFLYTIFDGSDVEGSVSLMSLCMIISAFIGYFGGQMLIQRKLRVFNKKTFIGFGAAAIICVFFLAIMQGGFFGREKYVPKAQKIVNAEIHAYGDGSADFYTGDPARIAKIISLHEDLIRQKKEILDSYQRIFSGEMLPGNVYAGGGRILISYTYDNGRMLEREYNLQFWSDRHELDGILDKVHELTDDSDNMLRHLHYGEKVRIGSVSTTQAYFEGDEATEFYNAIIDDIKEGTCRNHALDPGSFNALRANIEIIIPRADGTVEYDFERWNYEEILINREMQHSMDFMQSHGVDINNLWWDY